MSASNCFIHPDLPANETCSRCQKLICDPCSSPGPDGGTICPNCMAALADARKRNRFILMAVTAGAVIALVAFLLMTRGGDGDSEPVSPLLADGFDYGNGEQAVRNLVTIFEAEPCNKTVARDLGDSMNRAGNHRGALKVVATYDESCEPFRKLWWVELYAHQQLGQWDQALLTATRLVEAYPIDSSYWWWRAEANARTGNRLAAQYDVRQSLARNPRNRYAYQWLSELDPCAGGFAGLRRFAAEPDATWLEDQARQALARPMCKSRLGTGSAELRRAADAAKLTATATIAGQPVIMEVSLRLGPTVLSKATADALGLKPGSETVKVMLDSGVVDGNPITLDRINVGDAAANQVAAVIVDTLPDEAAAILGLSFLWRFEIAVTSDDDGDGITLYELPSM